MHIPADQPVLIAGPTASGKSALALHIARTQGGIIVNADALQVFDCWNVLSARPDASELALAPHALYGHVDYRQAYSVGHWLRDITPFLQGNTRPIIVGGTGLYFTALTEGLADIPATPPDIRARANQMNAQDMLAQLDAASVARIDVQNPMRIQRAWEVLQSTGHGIAHWQDQTPPPLLPLSQTTALVLEADKDWLNGRIERRFEHMLENGACGELRAIADDWDPARPSAKAIGAPELMAHLNGEISLTEAKSRSIISSRQYAKRQRSWFRARMKTWARVPANTV